MPTDSESRIFFPPMCEKKKHTVLSQNVLHATEIVAIFSWEKILEEKASVSYVYHAMEWNAKQGVGYGGAPISPVPGMLR